ncbi:DUF485 domain-containing protein [Solilutibacter silvestris]|uniref:DUF485 domain-containing protein n=1 Tax=Solilutibacter silvestris TaxID=1645665 RepID=A0A2K1Q0P9_9GAMM|nr:DUF485 domain-containing protein [Lysobacter silvestris]PNS08619.1 hypothetical protein Lysil_0248 [Lysobacter silvestris]
MNATGDPRIDRIAASPLYQELKHKRNTLGWTLTILMLIAYFGYIGLIAFDKAFLAQPIGDGVSTIGIPIAIGLMVFTILLTGFYVRRANNEFDRLAAQVLEETR